MTSSEAQEATAVPNDVRNDLKAENPQPRYCIRRNNDCYVPLIPVDELPSNICLEGISIHITHAETINLGMQFCGDQPAHNGSHYGVQVFENGHATGDKTFDSSSGALNTPQESSIPIKQECIDANISMASGSQPDSKKSSMFDMRGVKQYCTHWIRTGNCDYMQEGCKYKHEVPDESTLREIGIRTYPRWLREDPSSPHAEVFGHAPQTPVPQNPAIQQDWRRPGSQSAQAASPRAVTPVERSARPQSVTSGRGFFRGSVVNGQTQVHSAQGPFFSVPKPYFPNSTPEAQQQSAFRSVTGFPSPLGSAGLHSAFDKGPSHYQSPSPQPGMAKQHLAAQDPAFNRFAPRASAAPDSHILAKANEQANNGIYFGTSLPQGTDGAYSPPSRNNNGKSAAKTNNNASPVGHGLRGSVFPDIVNRSPPPVHRRRFLSPGQEEFVSNPIDTEPKNKKKHAHGNGNRHGKGAQATKEQPGFDLLSDYSG